jgi:hypothetical protein
MTQLISVDACKEPGLVKDRRGLTEAVRGDPAEVSPVQGAANVTASVLWISEPAKRVCENRLVHAYALRTTLLKFRTIQDGISRDRSPAFDLVDLRTRP